MSIGPFFKCLSHAFLLSLWWEVGCASFPFSYSPVPGRRSKSPSLSFPFAEVFPGLPSSRSHPICPQHSLRVLLYPSCSPWMPVLWSGLGSPPGCPVASRSGTLSSDGGSGRCLLPLLSPTDFSGTDFFFPLKLMICGLSVGARVSGFTH